MVYHVEIDREEDGRYIAEVPELPGVLAYGQNEQEARRKVEALALRVLAGRVEAGEHVGPIDVSFRRVSA